jgi:chromosome segregation ATPase
MTVMQPQGMVIRKFYDQMVAEARNLFSQVSSEVEAWLRRALSPLMIQMREHEENLDRRVNNLREVYENMRSLEGRIEELDGRQAQLSRRVAELEEIRTALAQPMQAARIGARAA